MLCSTKYNKVKFFTFIIFLLCLLLTDLKTISAQDITFVNFIKIEQADIKTGMIISKKGQEFIKSDKEYDNNVIGVINNNSNITLEPLDPTETIYIY
ncbi:MAG: hypothetical protein KatS3mg090_0682 [Patescibacteria group bacterium]|nr:MAG: hypothetical protein KatS3mg090_0682 [Patescibacteria group bacterium]